MCEVVLIVLTTLIGFGALVMTLVMVLMADTTKESFFIVSIIGIILTSVAIILTIVACIMSVEL